MANGSDLRQLLRRAEKAGCSITQGRKHTKVICPNGAIVVVASSTRNWRAHSNARAQLRRLGGLDL